MRSCFIWLWLNRSLHPFYGHWQRAINSELAALESKGKIFSSKKNWSLIYLFRKSVGQDEDRADFSTLYSFIIIGLNLSWANSRIKLNFSLMVRKVALPIPLLSQILFQFRKLNYMLEVFPCLIAIIMSLTELPWGLRSCYTLLGTVALPALIEGTAKSTTLKSKKKSSSSLAFIPDYPVLFLFCCCPTNPSILIEHFMFLLLIIISSYNLA